MNEALTAARDSLLKCQLSPDVVEKLFAIALGKEKWCDELCSRHDAEVVWRLWVEGGRKLFTGAEFGNWITADGKDDSETIRAVVEQYEKHSPELLQLLSTIRCSDPRVVDVHWKAGYQFMNNLVGAHREPVCHLTLSTLSVGQMNSEDFDLQLDRNQLQDLNWKLKEGLNFLENLKNYNDSRTLRR